MGSKEIKSGTNRIRNLDVRARNGFVGMLGVYYEFCDSIHLHPIMAEEGAESYNGADNNSTGKLSPGAVWDFQCPSIL